MKLCNSDVIRQLCVWKTIPLSPDYWKYHSSNVGTSTEAQQKVPSTTMPASNKCTRDLGHKIDGGGSEVLAADTALPLPLYRGALERLFGVSSSQTKDSDETIEIKHAALAALFLIDQGECEWKHLLLSAKDRARKKQQNSCKVDDYAGGMDPIYTIDDEDHLEFLQRSTILQEVYNFSHLMLSFKLSLEDWQLLVRVVYELMHVVAEQHPMLKVATSFEKTDERPIFAKEIHNLMQHKDFKDTTPFTVTSSSACQVAPASPALLRLRVAKVINDRYSTRPLLFGILLGPPPSETERDNTSYLPENLLPPHSCFPTAQLELRSTTLLSLHTYQSCNDDSMIQDIDRNNQLLSVTSLYEEKYEDEEKAPSIPAYNTARVSEERDVTVSFLLSLSDPVELREAAVLRKTGHGCGCLRCRLEAQLGAEDANNYKDEETDEHVSKVLAFWEAQIMRNSTACDHGVDNMSGSTYQANTAIRSMIRLGRYYMGAAKTDLAHAVYKFALTRLLQKRQEQQIELCEKGIKCDATPSSSIAKTSIPSNYIADIYHALGAIELSNGHFLRAQRIWKDGADRHHDACHLHPGIMLQVAKIKAYGYLDRSVEENEHSKSGHKTEKPKQQDSASFPGHSSHLREVRWTNPVEGTFVTTLLNRDECRKVIAMAELGEWTHQRHYAVPTHDVPVHTVPRLLEWFQNNLMGSKSGDQSINQDCVENIRNPSFRNGVNALLSQQFGGESCSYFVHDAFCVRYQAGQKSNHLPIHTDESTHSFVLALNDEYTGGGTYFWKGNTTVKLRAGELLSFRGDELEHGGAPLESGVRYILAVFLYRDDSNSVRKEQEENAAIKGKQNSSADKKLTSILRQAKKQKTEFRFGFCDN